MAVFPRALIAGAGVLILAGSVVVGLSHHADSAEPAHSGAVQLQQGEQTTDNLKVAQKFVDAYNSGDPARVKDMLTEDAEILIPAMGMANGRGSEQGQKAMGLVTQRTIEVHRMIASGDAVAIEFLWHAISSGGPGLAPAGSRLEMEDCIVLDIRDGLVSRYVEYIGRYEGIDLAVVSGRVVGSRQGS